MRLKPAMLMKLLACIGMPAMAIGAHAGDKRADAAQSASQLSVSDLTPYLRHFAVAGTDEFLTIYSNRPLAGKHAEITRAVVVVHGAGRDADEQFRTMMAAAYLTGALKNTLIIAPRYAAAESGVASCADAMETKELQWDCANWKYGEASKSAPRVTSYAILDDILRTVSSAGVFPNLKHIIVTGHSAGGVYVSRYAMLNVFETTAHVPINYLPANASAYAYLDDVRPVYPPDVTRAFSDLVPETLGPAASQLKQLTNANGCNAFNDWPMGLQHRTGYSATVDEETIKLNFVRRQITFLVGQNDNFAQAGMDDSCSAMAQGANRLVRGADFWRYGNVRYHATHELKIVPLCGHNARCMYTSPITMPLIFRWQE